MKPSKSKTWRYHHIVKITETCKKSGQSIRMETDHFQHAIYTETVNKDRIHIFFWKLILLCYCLWEMHVFKGLKYHRGGRINFGNIDSLSSCVIIIRWKTCWSLMLHIVLVKTVCVKAVSKWNKMTSVCVCKDDSSATTNSIFVLILSKSPLNCLRSKCSLEGAAAAACFCFVCEVWRPFPQTPTAVLPLSHSVSRCVISLSDTLSLVTFVFTKT